MSNLVIQQRPTNTRKAQIAIWRPQNASWSLTGKAGLQGRRSTLGFALWSTERELQEALGNMPRACERKAASQLPPGAEP